MEAIWVAAVMRAGRSLPDEVLSRIAPIGHKHINLRGILTFDLAQHRPGLLSRTVFVRQERASS